MRLIAHLILLVALTLGLSLPAAGQGLGDKAKDVKGTVDDIRDAVDDDDDDEEAEEDDEKSEDSEGDKGGDDKKD